MGKFDNRTFYFLPVGDTGSLDFGELLENGEVLRVDATNTNALVKFTGSTPDTITNLETKYGPYTYSEILDILTGSAWTDITYK